MNVAESVRELRNALGESQQAFACRMRTAIRTIARYETARPPKGKALADLFRIAANNGNPELANVFREALAREIGMPIYLPHPGLPANETCEPMKDADSIDSPERADAEYQGLA